MPRYTCLITIWPGPIPVHTIRSHVTFQRYSVCAPSIAYWDTSTTSSGILKQSLVISSRLELNALIARTTLTSSCYNSNFISALDDLYNVCTIIKAELKISVK